MTHRLAFGVALMASLGLHVAGLSLGSSRDATLIEAGSGAMDVAVGNSFADMAAGTLKTTEVTELEPVSTQQPEMVRPTPVTEESTTKLAAQTDPYQKPTKHVEVTQPNETVLTQPEPVAHISSKEAAITETAAADPIVVPTIQKSVVSAEPSIETLADENAPTSAPVVSKRPIPRPASLVVPKPKPTPKPRVTAPAARGNADQNAKAGTQAKPSNSIANHQGTKSTAAKAQGNAAATNYPGQVMRKINRVPRPRVSADGSAIVRFKIASNGGLAGLSLTRSSGSSRFDEAALRVIQRAAPFPKPPPGAQRSFSLTIKGG